MAFEYKGLHPVPDGKGGIVRPGDIWDEEPGFGPFAELPDEPEDAQEAPEATGPPAAPPAPPRPPAASTPPARAEGN